MATIVDSAAPSAPGHVCGLWGHDNQVALCGSHSAGIR